MPWIAFELVRGAALSEALRWGRLTRWTQARAVLLALLSALAHAHARGVVHLDVKPGNLLLPGGRFEAARLTDFGVALAFDSGGIERIFGTPSYMAPEQFRGVGAGLGPWTDLYAVGCLAFELCAFGPPVLGSNEACAEAHLAGALRPFRPRIDVPDGLADWLEALLSPMGQRPTSAAAVRAGLLRLGAAVPGSGDPVPATALEAPTLTLGTSPLVGLGDGTGAQAPWRAPDAAVPDVPPRWPQARRAPPRPVHDRASPSIAGRRAIPLIGRERAKEVLWEALIAVLGAGSASVWVRGPVGAGRSAVLRRFGQACTEVGACPVFEVDVAAEDPLTSAVCSRLSLSDLTDWKVRARALGLSPGWIDATALALERSDLWRWLRLVLSDGPHVVLLPSPRAHARLEAFTTQTLWVVRASGPPPAGARDCPVLPLGPAEIQVLLRHVVPLEPIAAERWAIATGGRAGRLVTGLLDRLREGAVAHGEQGFIAPVPELHPARAVPEAEALAVLPVPVERVIAVALLGSALHDLVERGVLWSIDGRIGFVDPDVQGATVAAAPEASALRRSAAEVLLAHLPPGPPSTGFDARILATILLEQAGDRRRAGALALGWVLETCGNRSLHEWVALAARAHRCVPSEESFAALEIERAALDRAEGRIGPAGERVEALEPPPRLRMRAHVERGRILGMRNELQRAIAVIAAPAPAPTAGVRAYRDQMHGAALTWAGRGDAAESLLRTAYASHLDLERWVSAGYCALRLSQLNDQEAWLAKAHEAFSRAEHGLGLGETASKRGHIARAEGRLDEAAAHYQRSLQAFLAHHRGDFLFAELNLGLVALAAGRTVEALDQFEQTWGEAVFRGANDAAYAALLGRLAASARTSERADVLALIDEVRLGQPDTPPEADALWLLAEARVALGKRGWGELEDAVRSLAEAHG